METQVINDWLVKFEKSIKEKDIDAILDLFDKETYWRDLISFTWNIITLESKEDISLMLNKTIDKINPENFKIQEMLTSNSDVHEARFTFETITSKCIGHIRLINGKCKTLLTLTDSLKDYEENKGYKRELGTEFGFFKDRKNWLENRNIEIQNLEENKNPYCLIVGGGQGGIALAARLRQLNVPTIVIDKNQKPGDSWRNRYHSLCLHDTVWYDHMPYLPFPDHWPIFSPKDKIGDWLEMYTKIMEINYWGSTECLNASYDQKKQTWEVIADREGQEIKLTPRHLILATGMSGMPQFPDIKNINKFKGDYCHSSGFKNGLEYRGKNAVVVGSNNSAHDIAAELWEQGAANVTMIQRSATTVAKSKTLTELSSNGVYSENAAQAGITTNIADITVASTPYRLIHVDGQKTVKELKDIDKQFYTKLEKSGFMFDWGEDESGLSVKYLRRGSGYYIDVGGSDLIINGEIKLESPAEVEEFKENSVVLSNGKEIKADLVVFATGYGSMNGWAAKLISQEVADKVGKCWGLGSDTKNDPGPWEGELRNMWKPTHQEALWFHGGNLAQSRHYSKYLTFQLKARYENIPFEVYGIPKVNHLS